MTSCRLGIGFKDPGRSWLTWCSVLVAAVTLFRWGTQAAAVAARRCSTSAMPLSSVVRMWRSSRTRKSDLAVFICASTSTLGSQFVLMSTVAARMLPMLHNPAPARASRSTISVPKLTARRSPTLTFANIRRVPNEWCAYRIEADLRSGPPDVLHEESTIVGQQAIFGNGPVWRQGRRGSLQGP